VEVLDGDTIVVAGDAGKSVVDLAAIDAPELGQPSGSEARELVVELARGNPVVVELTGTGADGHPAGRVVVGDTDLAMALLAAGLAWHDTLHDDQEALVIEQIKARGSRTGLWSGEDPVPPWDWRAAHAPTPTPAPRRATLADVAGSYELKKNEDGRTVITQPAPSTDRRGSSGGAPAIPGLGPQCCCKLTEVTGTTNGDEIEGETVYRLVEEYACEHAVAIVEQRNKVTLVPEYCVDDSMCR
jgi:hypothetical protein